MRAIGNIRTARTVVQEWMVSDMEKLKPCPFCGGEVKTTKVLYGLIFFKCKKCGAVVSFDNDYYNRNPDKAVYAWNRRAEE